MALRTPAFNDAKSYGFEWLRAMQEVDNQEGVVNGGDLKATAAAAGGQRVDIAAGTALVKGDSGIAGTGLSQGLFLIVNDAAVANAVTLNASDGTNPRIDQIVLRVRDSSDLGSGADDAVFEVVTGAPTAGATLDNRNGAAALPNDRLRLADVLVPAASSAVLAANVRDRRSWARGFNRQLLRAAGGVDYTNATSTFTLVSSTTLQPRVECSSGLLELRFTVRVQPSVADLISRAIHSVDGAPAADGPPNYRASRDTSWGVSHEYVAPAVSVTPGSHLIGLMLATTGTGTITVPLSANNCHLAITERVSQNTDNT